RHPPTPDLSTLSLHDALPTSRSRRQPGRFQIRLARAEEHELAARLEHGRQALEYQVEPLLPGQPRHHGDDRPRRLAQLELAPERDRKSTRLNSSHDQISYAVF